MSQSYLKYAGQFEPYEFTPDPSSALSVSPLVLAKMGQGKSTDWHEGKDAALLCLTVGLRKDGILGRLLMQNKLAALLKEKENWEVEKQQLTQQVADEKAINTRYRGIILQQQNQALAA